MLIVKDGGPNHSSIGGLPDSTADCAEIERVRVAGNTRGGDGTPEVDDWKPAHRVGRDHHGLTESDQPADGQLGNGRRERLVAPAQAVKQVAWGLRGKHSGKAQRCQPET